MLVMSDGTIPFPELIAIYNRALGCGGKVLLIWLQEGNIASHSTLLLRWLSPLAGWAGLSASSQALQTGCTTAGLGALNEAMVGQLEVVWHEALQLISSH